MFVGLEDSLLNSPVHSEIRDHEGRCNVKSISSASSPGVEDCRIECAGERTLAVRGDGVGCYAFLFLRS